MLVQVQVRRRPLLFPGGSPNCFLPVMCVRGTHLSRLVRPANATEATGQTQGSPGLLARRWNVRKWGPCVTAVAIPRLGDSSGRRADDRDGMRSCHREGTSVSVPPPQASNPRPPDPGFSFLPSTLSTSCPDLPFVPWHLNIIAPAVARRPCPSFPPYSPRLLPLFQARCLASYLPTYLPTNLRCLLLSSVYESGTSACCFLVLFIKLPDLDHQAGTYRFAQKHQFWFSSPHYYCLASPPACLPGRKKTKDVAPSARLTQTPTRSPGSLRSQHNHFPRPQPQNRACATLGSPIDSHPRSKESIAPSPLLARFPLASSFNLVYRRLCHAPRDDSLRGPTRRRKTLVSSSLTPSICSRHPRPPCLILPWPAPTLVAHDKTGPIPPFQKGHKSPVSLAACATAARPHKLPSGPRTPTVTPVVALRRSTHSSPDLAHLLKLLVASHPDADLYVPSGMSQTE